MRTHAPQWNKSFGFDLRPGRHTPRPEHTHERRFSGADPIAEIPTPCASADRHLRRVGPRDSARKATAPIKAPINTAPAITATISLSIPSIQ